LTLQRARIYGGAMAVPSDPPRAVAAGPLQDAAIVAFVGSTALDRAHGFYGGVLGLERSEASVYANAYDVGGTSLRVTRVDRVAPAPYTVLGWRVEDVRRAIAGLAASGVEILRFSGLEQDADGVWAAPGGAGRCAGRVVRRSRRQPPLGQRDAGAHRGAAGRRGVAPPRSGRPGRSDRLPARDAASMRPHRWRVARDPPTTTTGRPEGRPVY
jgi:hypothetical protein